MPPSSTATAINVPDESSKPIDVSCHCGRTQLTLPCLPKKLNECHCTACYSYGALWSYYRRGDVTVTTSAEPAPGVSQQFYAREDEGSRGDVGFYRCGHCGNLTHWWGLQNTKDKARTGPNAKMGVNCKLLKEEDIEGVERVVTRR